MRRVIEVIGVVFNLISKNNKKGCSEMDSLFFVNSCNSWLKTKYTLIFCVIKT